VLITSILEGICKAVQFVEVGKAVVNLHDLGCPVLGQPSSRSTIALSVLLIECRRKTLISNPLSLWESEYHCPIHSRTEGT